MAIGDSNIIFDTGGGSTPASILKSIAGYNINVGSDLFPNYVEVRDYCPLYPGCSTELITNCKNSSGTESLKGVPFYAEDLEDYWWGDTWVKNISLPYYDNNTFKWCIRGSKPSFGILYNIITTPTVTYPYILRKNSTSLVLSKQGVTIQTLTASDFIDGVLPSRVILAIQGSGGSGGNGNWNSSSGGGGSGGLWIGVVNLDLGDVHIILGAGGAKNSGENSGNAGSDSYLYVNNSLCVTVGGGGAGCYEAPEKGGGAGGDGGVCTIMSATDGALKAPSSNYKIWTINNISGSKGGNYGGNNGVSKTSISCWSTWKVADRGSGSANRLSLLDHVGGVGNGSDQGGGGGASYYGNGGNGGYWSNFNYIAATDGVRGSGGGGAGTNAGAPQPQGGAGGDALFSIFY